MLSLEYEGKINFNNANYYGIIIMSKINAPIHSYDTSQIYYQRPKIWQKMCGNFFGNFFLANETRYINSDVNLGSSSFFNNLLISERSKKDFFNIPFNNLFQSLDCLFVCLENLAVQPNSEKVDILSLGGLMPACRPEGLPEGLQ